MPGNGESRIGFRVEIVVEPDDNGFHAYCPALKGLHTCGDTEEEALSNASDAAEAYLRSLIKHGDPIPVGMLTLKPARRVASLQHRRGPEARHHTKDLVVDAV